MRGMRVPRSLAFKLVTTGLFFLLLALGSIALTLWVTWQLEGGAAAVNEAGRMRMLSYRMALQQQGSEPAQVRATFDMLDGSLERLRTGEPSRPLFVPWNENTRESFAAVQARWQQLRPLWASGAGAGPSMSELDDFVQLIDRFVRAIEHNLSRWTDLLRAFQFTMVALAIGSAVALLYTAHLVVFEPLQRLQHGLQRVSDGDFSARVELDSGDEFSQLADGFNRMAGPLQDLYGELEAKVAEKTERLEVKRERLAALYEVSAFIAGAETLPSLAQGFAELVRGIARADAVAVRWSDEANERYLMLAADGLPDVLAQDEQCLPSGNCHCGQMAADARLRVLRVARGVVGPVVAEGAAIARVLVVRAVRARGRGRPHPRRPARAACG